MLEGKKVLVTGGAGFIGSNLCEALLEQRCHVVCLDNFATGKKQNLDSLMNHGNFELFEGDIRNYDTCKSSMQGVSIVFHQAALGSVLRSINDPITTNIVNIDGFLNMLHAAKELNVERFIYAASSSTYGDHKALPKVEDQIGKPLSPYAVTKYVNELYAKVFSDLYGIKTIGLRYFNVFGRKQDPDGAYAAAIPKFIKALMNYQSLMIHGDGTQSRDFTYIDNVIDANIKAAIVDNEKAFNTVYNIAFGEKTELDTLVEYLRTLLGNFDPKINDLEIIHGPERVGDIRHSLADISKAQKLINYDPKFDIKKGLDNAIEWYWENLKQ